MNLAEIKFSFARNGSGGVSSSQINAINSEIEEIWEAISQHVDITNALVDKLAVTSSTSTILESKNIYETW